MEALQIHIDVEDLIYGDQGIAMLTVRDAAGTLVHSTDPIIGTLFYVNQEAEEMTEVSELEACILKERASPRSPSPVRIGESYIDNLNDAERVSRDAAIIPGQFAAPFDTSTLPQPAAYPQRCMLSFTVPFKYANTSVVKSRFFNLHDPNHGLDN